MPNTPLVTVIINTYNSARYLAEAIQSVLSSDYPNFELIVWDNQSNDNTRELVAGIKDGRLRYLYAPRHTELGEARNLAVEYANGTYIGFCDADDMWDAGKISAQVAFFQANPNTVAVFTDAAIIDANGNRTGTYSDRVRFFSGRITEKLLIKCPLVLSSCLVKKDVMIGVGCFPLKFSYIEEYECWLKMSLLGEIHVLPECLTVYREHGAQKSRDLMLRYRETSEMILSFRSESSWKTYEKFLSFSLIKASLQACRYALKIGNGFMEPFRTLWREFWRHPVNHIRLLSLHIIKGY